MWKKQYTTSNLKLTTISVARCFPWQPNALPADLTYTVRLTDANTGPQAGVVLYKDGAEDMLYVYAFQWHNGWYLLEISHLAANDGF